MRMTSPDLRMSTTALSPQVRARQRGAAVAPSVSARVYLRREVATKDQVTRVKGKRDELQKSTREPASFTGVVGLTPSRQRKPKQAETFWAPIERKTLAVNIARLTCFRLGSLLASRHARRLAGTWPSSEFRVRRAFQMSQENAASLHLNARLKLGSPRMSVGTSPVRFLSASFTPRSNSTIKASAPSCRATGRTAATRGGLRRSRPPSSRDISSSSLTGRAIAGGASTAPSASIVS